jgi:hypothetical protein
MCSSVQGAFPRLFRGTIERLSRQPPLLHPEIATERPLLRGKGGDMPERSAYCFVFDTAVDNFYFGGANFSPYEKFILYVSEDVMNQPSPQIDTYLSDICPTGMASRIRRLTGRFYLTDTFHN